MNFQQFCIELKVMLYRKTLYKYGMKCNHKHQNVRINDGVVQNTVYINQKSKNRVIVRYNARHNIITVNEYIVNDFTSALLKLSELVVIE